MVLALPVARHGEQRSRCLHRRALLSYQYCRRGKQESPTSNKVRDTSSFSSSRGMQMPNMKCQMHTKRVENSVSRHQLPLFYSEAGRESVRRAFAQGGLARGRRIAAAAQLADSTQHCRHHHGSAGSAGSRRAASVRCAAWLALAVRIGLTHRPWPQETGETASSGDRAALQFLTEPCFPHEYPVSQTWTRQPDGLDPSRPRAALGSGGAWTSSPRRCAASLPSSVPYP